MSPKLLKCKLYSY